MNFDSKILDGSVQFDIEILENEFCERSSTITTENNEIPNIHGNKLVLDARHLTIKKVLYVSVPEPIPLEFQVDTERESIIIEMDRTKDRPRIQLVIFYSTSPDQCTALQWLTKEQTANRQYPYMFSQCQAIHARALYPCQDTPGVKSTYTAKVTCPKPLTVVSDR